MDYSISTDIKYGPLEIIDTSQIVSGVVDKWWNQSMCRVNDCVVRLGIFEGEFHWHKHIKEDEFFFVLEGKLFLDLENRQVELGPHQGFMVPREIMHRTRAPEKTVVLMIESSTIEPEGD
jgi:mannose-6-phosphate isomerase-like protein (cupin superfamily)